MVSQPARHREDPDIAAALDASAAFNWPPRVHELVIAATMLLLVLRLSWIVVSIAVAPGRSQRRLVPVGRRRAPWLAAAMMAALALLALGQFVTPLVETGVAQARHLAGALRLAAYSAAALLLAGAGVLGIALGFGAQALVRDVIAGIFYLAEDAFRVGEYVESGTNIKGTVERITLRSVALRHHNGPLHFVPYGSLGTVRNTSRDWVIDKFNLPLPIEVESEAIRKMIKKVGEDMRADPAIGPLMIEPLKGKLYRIDPGVKLFRCKFRSPPGKQFDVRANALKRIEAALRKMNLQFADGRHTVLLQQTPAA